MKNIFNKFHGMMIASTAAMALSSQAVAMERGGFEIANNTCGGKLKELQDYHTEACGGIATQIDKFHNNIFITYANWAGSRTECKLAFKELIDAIKYDIKCLLLKEGPIANFGSGIKHHKSKKLSKVITADENVDQDLRDKVTELVADEYVSGDSDTYSDYSDTENHPKYLLKIKQNTFLSDIYSLTLREFDKMYNHLDGYVAEQSTIGELIDNITGSLTFIDETIGIAVNHPHTIVAKINENEFPQSMAFDPVKKFTDSVTEIDGFDEDKMNAILDREVN